MLVLKLSVIKYTFLSVQQCQSCPLDSLDKFTLCKVLKNMMNRGEYVYSL